MIPFLKQFNETKERVLEKYIANETEKFLRTEVGKKYLFHDNICMSSKNKTCKVDVKLVSIRDTKLLKTINTVKCREAEDSIEIQVGLDNEYFDTYDTGSLSALMMISWLNQVIIKYISGTNISFMDAFNSLIKSYPEVIVYYKAGLLQSKIPTSITSTYFPPSVSMGEIIDKIL